MTLTVLSGILAGITTLLFGARFVLRNKVGLFDLFTVIGGHFTHGLAMVYMAVVMLGVKPIFGWDWIVYFYLVFALVFLLRLILVVRVEQFNQTPIIGFEKQSTWWWEVVHTFNHLAMAYMFLELIYWNEILTVLAIISSTALMIIGISGIPKHLGPDYHKNRAYALFGDFGHISMALSMIIMFGIMQWSMGSMNHGESHHDHAKHSAHAEDDQGQIVAQLMKQFHTEASPLSVGPVSLSGNWAVAGWLQDGKGGRGLLQKTDTGWFIYLCSGSSLKDVEILIEIGVPKADAQAIVDQLLTAEKSLRSEDVVLQDSFAGTVIIGTNGVEDHGAHGHTQHKH
jgi:hypothetical protein